MIQRRLPTIVQEPQKENVRESLRKKVKTSRGKNRFMDTFRPSLIPFVPLHSTFSLSDISRIS